jgi:peptidoglycan L-alanyl-D-glutamate endopeptidase CwlK
MRFFVVSKKYILSKLSLSRLVGLHARLEAVVKRAIEITEQDFMVMKVFVQKSNALSIMVKVAQQNNV